MDRPDQITCACGNVRKVGPQGPIPWRCEPCQTERRKMSVRIASRAYAQRPEQIARRKAGRSGGK